MKDYKYNAKQFGFLLCKYCIFFFISVGTCLFNKAKGQAHAAPTPAVPALANYYTGMSDIGPNSDSVAGSPYLSRGWMTGQAQLTPNQTIPKPGETLYFNYDKTKNTLISTDPSGQLTYYTVNLVNSFILTDSTGKTYKFELFPAVSNSFFLVDVLKSDKGYSLYKRFITKVSISNNQGQGTFEVGQKHDVYSDVVMYYLIYPGNNEYKNFQLSEKAVKKAFKDEPFQIDPLLDKYKSKFNEASLIEIVDSVNTKYHH
jgi:hypothetical protein